MILPWKCGGESRSISAKNAEQAMELLEKMKAQYIDILDHSFVRSAFQKITDKMLDANFMVYAIEETLRLMQLSHYNLFELKDIVLNNEGYQ